MPTDIFDWCMSKNKQVVVPTSLHAPPVEFYMVVNQYRYYTAEEILRHVT